MAPDGVYQLNLAEREQHIVAQMCVQLSVMEEGDNCIDEFFGDTPQTMRPFVTPRSWLEAVPGMDGPQPYAMPAWAVLFSLPHSPWPPVFGSLVVSPVVFGRPWRVAVYLCDRSRF